MVKDNAHRVLDIFSYFESKAGDVLLANSFVAIGKRRRWDMIELQEGIEEAHRKGWISAGQLGWRLTENGFSESVKRS